MVVEPPHGYLNPLNRCAGLPRGGRDCGHERGHERCGVVERNEQGARLAGSPSLSLSHPFLSIVHEALPARPSPLGVLRFRYLGRERLPENEEWRDLEICSRRWWVSMWDLLWASKTASPRRMNKLTCSWRKRIHWSLHLTLVTKVVSCAERLSGARDQIDTAVLVDDGDGQYR